MDQSRISFESNEATWIIRMVEILSIAYSPLTSLSPVNSLLPGKCWNIYKNCHFQTQFPNRCLEIFLWDYLEVNATKPWYEQSALV